MRVSWQEDAIGDLIALRRYIAQENPRAAGQVAERIRLATRNLKAHPEIGRPGKIENTRELVIPGLPYIVIYRVYRETAVILRVLHGAMRWPERFQGAECLKG